MQNKYARKLYDCVTGVWHILFCAAGSVRVVNTLTGRCVHTRTLVSAPRDLEEGQDEEQVLTQAFLCPALDSVVIVTYDNNIVFHNNRDLSLSKQVRAEDIIHKT